MPAPPRSRRWLLAEIQLLSRMARQRASAEDIAQTLGRTVEAVRIKAAHQRISLTVTGRKRARLLEAPPRAREMED